MSDDNVVQFPRRPGAPTPVAEVLSSERIRDAKMLVVAGWDKDNLFFMSCTNGEARDNLYLLGIANHALWTYVTRPVPPPVNKAS